MRVRQAVHAQIKRYLDLLPIMQSLTWPYSELTTIDTALPLS